MKRTAITATFTVLPILAATLLMPSVRAADIVWKNAANGNWNDVTKWNPAQVPSTNDTAIITNAGTYTVTLNMNPVISGLELGGSSGTQTLRTSNHTLTLNGDAEVGTNGVMLLWGGALAGSSQYDVRGTLNWVDGGIASNATVTVATNGYVLAEGANYTRSLDGTLSNAGSIIWQTTGPLAIGGTLHNQESGEFDLRTGFNILQSGETGRIINDGLLLSSVGVYANCYAPLINNGTVDVQAGRLKLLDNCTFNAGCEFTGAGEIWLMDGTNTLTGSIYSENLEVLYNATLTGTGSFSGTLVWQGGSIGSDASLTVATNGHLFIKGANHTKYVNGTLSNAGTITWQPQGYLAIGGTLHNLETGIFDMQSSPIVHSGGLGSIVNDGLLLNSVGVYANCYVPLINNGTVDVQSGRLKLLDNCAFNSGCEFTGAGDLWLVDATNTLTGSLYSENLSLLYDGMLTGTGSISGAMTWGGGSIGPGADITVATNGHLLINGVHDKYLHGLLSNAGTITWQPSRYLYVDSTLHNLSGGLFDIQCDSSIKSNAPTAEILNAGTFRKSAGGGTTVCESRLVNNGTVEVQTGRLYCPGGFTNPAGTLSLAGGDFQTVETLSLPGGLLTGWGTVYASVVNEATVRPSRTNGVLAINGNYEQKIGGTTVFELGGNAPAVNQGRLNVTGNANLSGRVNVEFAGGYLPEPGTNFPVMAFASHNGEFDFPNGFFLLGHGRRLEPAYTATSVVLATVAAPEPTEVPLGIASEDGTVMVAWPLEFTGYSLYSKTNLLESGWTPVSGSGNQYLELPPLPPTKFFRLF